MAVTFIFSIDELAMDLDNIIKAMKNVVSKKFAIAGQKAIARATLPDLKDSEMEEIMTEIDEEGGKYREVVDSDRDSKPEEDREPQEN